MDRANMTSYLPVFYFQTYSGDDCRHKFLNVRTVLLPASSLHKKNSSARLIKEVRGLQANDVMLAPPI
jgi:hypothetical protein